MATKNKVPPLPLSMVKEELLVINQKIEKNKPQISHKFFPIKNLPPKMISFSYKISEAAIWEREKEGFKPIQPFWRTGCGLIGCGAPRNRLRDFHRGLPELRGQQAIDYVSSSERTMERQPSMLSSVSLQRAAASKVKKALGLKSSKKSAFSQQNSVSSKRAVTIGELMRVQMRISEQIDSSVRRLVIVGLILPWLILSEAWDEQ